MSAYLVVLPEAIQGYDKETENIKNIHIFDIEYNSMIKRWGLVNKHAHCSNEIMISKKYLSVDTFIKSEYFNKFYKLIETIGELRSYLAVCQNKGIEVCGQCVATLYSDNQ